MKKDHTNTRQNMVQSRPSMLKALRKARAFLFLVIFCVHAFVFVSPVSADIALPSCTTVLNVATRTLDASETTLSYSVNPSGLRDDTRFRVQYSADLSQGQTFDRSFQPFTESFSISVEQIRAAPQSIYLDSGGNHFCHIDLIYDEQSGKIVIGEAGMGPPPGSFNLCQQAGPNRSTCDVCLSEGKIWTGVGCIPFSVETGTVRAFMTLGLGMTGGAVVLMTLYASFLLSTSQGDPKRIDEAKSAITSAIVGAFFIIFSVTILRFIGVEILKLPSFG